MLDLLLKVLSTKELAKEQEVNAAQAAARRVSLVAEATAALELAQREEDARHQEKVGSLQAALAASLAAAEAGSNAAWPFSGK